MLVLSRKKDEDVCIGKDIVIRIVDIRGDNVRLGVTAPIEVQVHRREVLEAIQREAQREQLGDGADAGQSGGSC